MIFRLFVKDLIGKRGESGSDQKILSLVGMHGIYVDKPPLQLNLDNTVSGVMRLGGLT